MLSPPSDLDLDELVLALPRWGLRDPRLEYLPVGFGSHHWRADTDDARVFVTVDDLAAGFQAGDSVDEAFAALERAYRTAASLRGVGGLEFVLGPLPDDEGTPIRRLSERYTVSVTPFVDGASSSWGPYESNDERRRVAELLGRLHVAGALVPADLPRRDDLTIPSRSVLDDALASLEEPWGTGPFADPARALLSASSDELRERLKAYDADAARTHERSDSWVVTHGEPHRANLIVGANGELRLIDWDTTRVAPRERDLWMVLDDELTGWDEYAAVCGDVSLDTEALDLCRRWWDLADIATFTALFRRQHADDENTAATFAGLRAYLETDRVAPPQ